MITSSPSRNTLRITALCSGYLPGYRRGGPGRSLAAIVSALGAEYCFYIITEDRDRGDAEPYPNISHEQWMAVGMAFVKYIERSRTDAIKILVAIKDSASSLVYLNSFFHLKYAIIPLFARKLRIISVKHILLAPRGEFSRGALSLKRLRKMFYIRIAKSLGILEGVTWQASTNEERQDIIRVIGQGANIVVVRNLTSIDLHAPAQLGFDLAQIPEGHSGERELRLVFLSRIARKKNLAFLIECLQSVRVRVSLDIYGPIEDINYWKSCQSAIDSLPSKCKARYCGALPHDKVVSQLACYDLFCLPTLGENFGHVFIEAWAAGLPVLTSDQTPWKSLKEMSLGLDAPLETGKAFTDFIEEVASWSTEQRSRIRQRCIQYARQQIEDPSVVQANRQMFLDLASRFG